MEEKIKILKDTAKTYLALAIALQSDGVDASHYFKKEIEIHLQIVDIEESMYYYKAA